MQILVIGYGKIGQIKASLWRSIGATVYVYDINHSAVQKSLHDGFKSYVDCVSDKDVIVDISSPAGQHFKSLQWTIETIASPIRYILIEKPLASSMEELGQFVALQESVTAKLLLNESYYSSTGLRKIIETIDETPSHVEIELSKNRLDDTARGRFFDTNLGAIGIETPHMLAVLQMLNISLDHIEITKADLYIDSIQSENQGYEIHFLSGNTSVILRSFLGNFTCKDSKLVESNRTVRTIKIRTKVHDLVLEFDPAPRLPRYHSRLTTHGTQNNRAKIAELADDHLREHLLQFQNKDPVNSFLEFDNAVHLSSVLCKLRDKFKIINITNQVSEAIPQPVNQEGM